MSLSIKWLVSVVFVALSINVYANLPSDVYTGYWAMSQKVLGEYLVVDFKKQANGTVLSTVYHFECDGTTRYRQLGQTKTRLVPSAGGFAVYEQDKTVPSSHLKLFHYTPKKKLFLTQSFTDQLSGLKQVFPDDMILLYYPTDILEPTCGIDPKP